MYVAVGGIDQWLQFHEAANDNPVLLYLHGGPGASSLGASAAWASWEEHFTVVHWDQRGSGLTFQKNRESGCGELSLDRMVEDGMEVAEFLTAHLRRRQILLVGHSWGSALGVHMIKRRPKLFSAFVGTGQVVNMQENEVHNYRRQLMQAERQQNAEALQILGDLGPPPFSEISQLGLLREWADKLAEGDGDAVQPRPSPRPTHLEPDYWRVMLEGLRFSSRLYNELMSLDLPKLGLDFEVPMFCIHGTEDQQTSFELAKSYFDSISAPHKEFIAFEGCHHFVVMNRPDAFLKELVTKVRPML